MQLLLTILVDCVLGLGLLTGLVLATCWGELCGIAPHRDKSGLGGFVAVFLFLPVRWLCVLVGLCHALWNGSLPFAPDAARTGTAIVLGAHVALGITTVMLFQLGLRRVERDLPAGVPLGVAGAVLLPLPAAWAGVVGAHPEWLGGPVAAWATALAIAGAFAAGFGHRLADMRRTHARLAGRAANVQPEPGPDERS